jgi:hypothetical protein
MVRARLAALAAAAGAGLVSGCLNLSEHPLFGRHHEPCCPSEAACCESVGGGPCQGPVLEDGAAGAYAAPPAALLTQPPGPQPVAPPRLVPQPQAPPMPYTPPR